LRCDVRTPTKHELEERTMDRPKEMKGWVDVSRVVSGSTAVFPGDTPFSREYVMSIEGGDSCNTSTIRLSSHTGTHVDAPSHFVDGAPGVDQITVDTFVGRCRVVHVKEARCIRPADVKKLDMKKEERLLFRTPRAPGDDEWRDDFTYLSVDAARALSGLRLVGIDTPSVDPKNSKTLEAHKILFENGVAILESLNLEGVPEGVYDLIALPLRIAGGEASPVRAVIRRRESGDES
jgi:arylformamidase